jgi:hypothetical protein
MDLLESLGTRAVASEFGGADRQAFAGLDARDPRLDDVGRCWLGPKHADLVADLGQFLAAILEAGLGDAASEARSDVVGS